MSIDSIEKDINASILTIEQIREREKGDVKTLFKLADFREELAEVLGKKVDVVTIGSKMHVYFKKQLEEDMIKIF